MGIDIWIHVEYLNRKRKRYKHSRANIVGDRNYLMFDLLSGCVGEQKSLYPIRGLPGNVTAETYRDYQIYKPDIHHASWLTTSEFRECLDKYHEILPAIEENEPEGVKRIQELLRQLFPDHPDTILSYELIYQYMKESEDEGEPARIVFWFDN